MKTANLPQEVFMLRQVMVPSKENSTISIPTEYYGTEVEIIVFPLETQQPNTTKKLPHYIGLNMPDFKFNRNEANNYEGLH